MTRTPSSKKSETPTETQTTETQTTETVTETTETQATAGETVADQGEVKPEVTPDAPAQPADDRPDSDDSGLNGTDLDELSSVLNDLTLGGDTLAEPAEVAQSVDYRVMRSFRHNGTRFMVNSTVTMAEEEARPFVQKGQLSAVADAQDEDWPGADHLTHARKQEPDAHGRLEHRVVRAFRHNGTRYKEGSTVLMTPEQAESFVLKGQLRVL